MRNILIVISFLAAWGLASASAQLLRQFPANAKPGELGAARHAYPLIEINGKLLRLAPGGLIFDRENRTIVHGALPPLAPILFVEDGTGQIVRIYLLRPEEAARFERAPRP